MSPQQSNAPRPVAQQPMPQPRKTGKTGLIVGLSAGSLVLLAVIIGMLIFVFGGPTRGDYRKAHEKTNDLIGKYNDIDASVTEAITDGASSDEISAIEGDVTQYSDESTKLSEMRALTKDEEAERLYDSFMQANDPYITFLNDITANSEAFAGVSENCTEDAIGKIGEDPAVIGDNYKKVMAPCLAAFADFSNLQSDVMKRFVSDGKDAFTDLQDVFVELQTAYNQQNIQQLNALVTKIEGLEDKYSSFMDGSIKDEVNELAPTDELNALGQYLTDKANGE